MTLEEAQAIGRVAAAKADVARIQRANTKEQLLKVRSQGRAAKRELDTLLKTVRQAEAEESRAQTELDNINNAIHRQTAAKPDGADFPTDVELAAWKGKLDQLTALRGKAVEKLRAAQQKDSLARLEAIRLDKALVGLRYQLRNLERVARGEPVAGGWQGGIGAPV